MSADQENPKNPQSPEINEPRIEAEKKQSETKTDTKAELSSLKTAVEGSSAATETAGDLLSAQPETPELQGALDPKRNIIRTVDYTEPARWFDPQTKPSNYPPDYFVQKNYNGEIPKRYEDTISSEELTIMRDQGEYVEKMSYPNSVEYYKTIMGGIPPNSEWIIGNADFFGQKVRTNIVLAIALKELEYKLKNLPGGKQMNPRFNTLTSYNPEKEKHHGLAMAIDFDPNENDVEKASETKWNIPMAMVLEAQKMGFDWGMYYFEGRGDRTTDAMHFAYRGRIPSLMKSLKSAEAIQMAKSFSVPGENKSLYEFDDTKYENLTEGGGSGGKVDTKQLEEEEKIISELASKYDIEVKKLKEKPEQLRSILGEADILEIRSNAKILFQKLYPNETATESQIIEAETTRRISAYTEGEATDFGWYTLNYKQVNESHEMQVGLGEILLDPSIKEIEVIRAGRKIKGLRGTKSGRVCFLDQNGNYIATYSGDKFRIITDKPLKEIEYNKELELENEIRKNSRQAYLEESERNRQQGIMPDGTIDNDYAISKMDPSKSPISRDNFSTTIDSHNSPIQGAELFEYSEKAGNEFGINPNILRAIIQFESAGLKWNAINPTTKASGFGQFLVGTWNGFAKYCKNLPQDKAEKLQQECGIKNIREISVSAKHFEENPQDLLNPEINFRINPKLAIYATAWLMNDNCKGKVNKNDTVFNQSIIYYLYHHEGSGGGTQYLQFIQKMNENNCFTRQEMRDEYLKNPEKYKNISVYTREKNRNIDDHLDVYFKYASRVARTAAGADPESIIAAQKRVEEKLANNPFDGELDETKIKSSERIDPGTSQIPYRFVNINEYLANGGSIGFTEGKGQKNFSPQIAESQLRFMASQGFKEVVSLVHKQEIQNVISANNLPIKLSEGLPSQYDTSMMTPANELIINKIAENINKNIKTYVHCRHGAHRAVISSALALLKAGKTNNLEEAFKMAKGNLGSFYNKNYIDILTGAMQYAKRLNASGTEFFERKIQELRSK